MNKHLKGLILLLISVLLYSIYYWAIPAVVNINSRMPVIAKFVRNNYNLNLDIKNPNLKMGLLPSIWISADSLNIKDISQNSLISMNSPKLKIQLVPLIFGQQKIKYFSANSINTKLRVDKKMHFFLGNIPLTRKGSSGVSFKDSKLFISNYKITLKDELQNKNIRISGDYLNVNKFNPDKILDASTNTKIIVNNNISKIKGKILLRLPFKKNFDGRDVIIDGSVENLNLSLFSPYIKKFSKGKIEKTLGIININSKTTNVSKNIIHTNANIKNLYIKLSQCPYPSFYNGELNINFNSIFAKNKLTIINMFITGQKVHARINGHINKIKSRNPKENLDVYLSNTKSEVLINLIPGIRLKNSQINLLNLKKYNFYSNVNGKITLKNNIKKPLIFGKVIVTNAFLIQPLKNAQKATIKLDFHGKHFHINVLVPVSYRDFVKVIGTVEIFDKHISDLNVTSSQNVNLSIAESVLVPLHEILNFDLGPVPIMSIKGFGNIKLKILGNKKNPHLWGTFNFKDTTASFKKINAFVNNGNGHLLFDNKNVLFYTTSALFNSKPIKISGKCKLKDSFAFKVETKNQNISNILTSLKTSPKLVGAVKQLDLLKAVTGNADIFLDVTGVMGDINNIKFNKNVFIKGKVKLNGVAFKINNAKSMIKNTFGTILFDGNSVTAKVKSMIGKSKIDIDCLTKDSKLKITVGSDSLYVNDIISYIYEFNLKNSNQIKDFSSAHLKFIAKYDGSLPFDINSLKFDANFMPSSLKKNNINITSGRLTINHGNLYFKKISGNYKASKFSINGNINDVISPKRNTNATAYINNFDFALLKEFSNYYFVPANTKKVVNKFSNITGKQNIKISIKNNQIFTKIHLKNISFVYAKTGLPVTLYSGYADFDGNKLVLYRANAIADTMPILMDGTIKNIFTKPNINLYLNTKPVQKFIDKYINKDSLYPLRIKGDILSSSRIEGTFDNLSIKNEINMNEDSFIYYMGGSLGDNSNPIRIYSKFNLQKNKVNISNFQYDKLVSSQNNKEFIVPQLFAKGIVNFAGNNVYLHNVRIVTQNPTDARIFNILFKKAVAKQGNFTSNVLVNGSALSPKLDGYLHFTGVDVPMLDTTLRDINLEFKGSKIFIKALGDVLANKVEISGVMQNKIKPPYIIDSLSLNCDNLDLNDVSRSISNFQDELAKRKISAEKELFDIKDLIISNADIKAKKVYVKGINATDFSSNLTLDDTMLLSLNNFKFNVADGFVKGTFKYSFFNNKTDLDLSVLNANANELADALFELPSQLYGDLSGNVSLYCNGVTHKKCMNTLNGRGGFEVKSGRMPKLGSLEYLLKASNLLKSGITGLTVNNLIDMVTPLKTGEFNSIHGDFRISSGIAHPVEIYSKGKDLDIFVDGSYNFSNSFADMNVFGRLSKKISTVMGPVGNASLNTLFNLIPGLHLDDPNNASFINDINKIPGFELNDKLYRIFNAKIHGDINGENYVQSFKWIE